MFDYNKKIKRRFFGGLEKTQEDVLERDIFRVEEDEHSAGSGGAARYRKAVSYIRHDFARNAYPALLCVLIGLAFLIICVLMMRKSGDGAGLILTALAVCSVIWSLAGAVYAVVSLFEKKRNYTLSFVSLGLGAAQLFIWLVIMGLR